MKMHCKKSAFDISAMRKEMFRLAKAGKVKEAMAIRDEIQHIDAESIRDYLDEPRYNQKKKGRRNK